MFKSFKISDYLLSGMSKLLSAAPATDLITETEIVEVLKGLPIDGMICVNIFMLEGHNYQGCHSKTVLWLYCQKVYLSLGCSWHETCSTARGDHD